MPTLIYADGFHHKTADGSRFGGAADTGLWSAVNTGGGITFGNETYDSGPDIQIVEGGAALANVQRGLAAGIRTLVGSFYFKITSGPSVDGSRLFFTTGPANNFKFEVKLSNGTIHVEIVSDGPDGPVVTDNAIHRVDFRLDTSGTTYTCDWAVDGTAQTQVTAAGQTAADLTAWGIGSSNAAHAMTFRTWHLVLSSTSGDHPIGAHRVLSLVPNADGANRNPGTNVMERASDGADINGVTAWNLLDEWPATGGVNNADTVTQVAIGTGNFAEVDFENTGEATIWAVTSVAALQSDGTNTNNGTTRIVDSSNNTLVDVYAGSMAVATPNYRVILVPDPGGDGWTQAELNGVKARVGFSSDVDSQPEWLALLLQYAVPVTAATDAPTLRTVATPLRW